MIDIFSRYVVGWCVVRRSNAAVAEHFVAEILERERIEPGQITLHNDRGTEMTAESFCGYLDALGVRRSLSRSRVSNDNPYSEAAFKTLKYTGPTPGVSVLLKMRARSSAISLSSNQEHRHSWIAMLSPATVHANDHDAVLAARYDVMLEIYATKPERFINGKPRLRELPREAWINHPTDHDAAA